jgi:hypothetical protein
MRNNVRLLLFFSCLLGIYFPACSKPPPHNEDLAARKALEFAQDAFIKQDMNAAYAHLTDQTRRYMSAEQMKTMVSGTHPKGYPNEVQAIEYEAIPAEPSTIHIFIVGRNPTEQFVYSLTMERTAVSDYKVVLFDRGQSFSKSPLRKSFPIPIT